MVMDWRECCRKDAKNIVPDDDMATSLIKTSKKKAAVNDQLSLVEETIEAKISLGYDSVRELLEALALQKGFKIYNHVCYTAFLKEFLNEEVVGEVFDEVRQARNDINYYGKEVSVEEARMILRQLGQLRVLLLEKVE